MAKPVILIKYQITKNDTFDDVERCSVKMQKQLDDYHVIVIPVFRDIDDGFEMRVLNVVDANEYFAEEIKLIIKDSFYGKTK